MLTEAVSGCFADKMVNLNGNRILNAPVILEVSSGDLSSEVLGTATSR